MRQGLLVFNPDLIPTMTPKKTTTKLSLTSEFGFNPRTKVRRDISILAGTTSVLGFKSKNDCPRTSRTRPSPTIQIAGADSPRRRTGSGS